MNSEEQPNHFYLDCFSTSLRLVANGHYKKLIKGGVCEYAEITGLFYEGLEPYIWVTKVRILNRGSIDYSVLDAFYINPTAGYAVRNEVNGYL